jgi:CRP-like cAMP-binding protein
MVTKDYIDSRLAQSPIFSACSKKELRAITSLATEVHVPEGRVVTEQGERGREFMIITEGEMSVWIDDEPVATLGPGDFFGELALLSKQPRNATVVAETDSVLQTVSRQEFSSMLDTSPALVRKLLSAVVTRLREADQATREAG